MSQQEEQTMSKVLHIQASPMRDLSFSTRAAQAFVAAYLSLHPRDAVETLDLWALDLPPFDFTAASGKYKVMRGLDHSDEEAQAWARVVAETARFKAADKFLLSTGMWNFSIPYRLKHYLDVIVQPGLTFAFDPDKGFYGLVTGRPLQVIFASGGAYPEGSPMAALDFQKPYVETIFRFMGFADIRVLRVQDTLSPQGEANLAAAMQGAEEAAKSF
jgi:FMN-dependent NADH-azoreductase